MMIVGNSGSCNCSSADWATKSWKSYILNPAGTKHVTEAKRLAQGPLSSQAAFPGHAVGARQSAIEDSRLPTHNLRQPKNETGKAKIGQEAISSP